jgi:hypothetical protein
MSPQKQEILQTLEIVAKYAESVNAQLGDLVQRLTVVEETLNTELQPRRRRISR